MRANCTTIITIHSYVIELRLTSTIRTVIVIVLSQDLIILRSHHLLALLFIVVSCATNCLTLALYVDNFFRLFFDLCILTKFLPFVLVFIGNLTMVLNLLERTFELRELVADEHTWSHICPLLSLEVLDFLKRGGDAFIVRRNLLYTASSLVGIVVAPILRLQFLLFHFLFRQVLLDFFLVGSKRCEEPVLHFLNTRQLVFVLDNATQHGHKIREVRDRLHFVEIEVSILNFFVDSM